MNEEGEKNIENDVPENFNLVLGGHLDRSEKTL